MPFIAIDTTTQKRTNITDIVDDHHLPKEEQHWECQLCNQQMKIRGGALVTRHFYHTQICKSNYTYHTETAEHRLGKRYIMRQFYKEYWHYTHAHIDYEVPIPEIQRVADILVTFPNGWRIAHECQLSPIQVDEYQARTHDYHQAEIDVYWWIGRKAAQVHNVQEWILAEFGFFLLVDFHEQSKQFPD